MSGVRNSCDRLSMNSARMRCSRRSSETSSSTSQKPAIGERRARTMSVWPGPSRTISPLAQPTSRVRRAIASIRWSPNAAIADSPTSPPCGRSRNACAASFASCTTRSSSSRTIPAPTRLTRWPRSSELRRAAHSADSRPWRSPRAAASTSSRRPTPMMSRTPSMVRSCRSATRMAVPATMPSTPMMRSAGSSTRRV